MNVLPQLKKQIGKARMRVLLFDVFNGCSTSITEINRLIIERNVEHLLLRKTDVLKPSIFSKRNFEEMHYL